MKRRGVQVLRDGKRAYVLVADKVNRFIPNPTFNPVIVPGCTELLFRGQIPAGVDPKSLSAVEPIHQEYGDRRAPPGGDGRAGAGRRAALSHPRLRRRAGPTSRPRGDDGAACRTSTAGWKRTGDSPTRTASSPHRCCRWPIPTRALIELESLLERGAKLIHLRPAPVPAAGGPRSFGHPAHDPVWARIAEADVPVAFHLGDSGYLTYSAAWGGASEFEPFRQVRRAGRRPRRRPGHLRHDGIA